MHRQWISFWIRFLGVIERFNWKNTTDWCWSIRFWSILWADFSRWHWLQYQKWHFHFSTHLVRRKSIDFDFKYFRNDVLDHETKAEEKTSSWNMFVYCCTLNVCCPSVFYDLSSRTWKPISFCGSDNVFIW